MDEENFELSVELGVNTPLKKDSKEEFSNFLINSLEGFGGRSIKIQESYYMARKSAEALQTVVFILGGMASVTAIIKFSLDVCSMFKKKYNNEGSIFVKLKDGRYTKIKNGMTEEEILKSLNNDNDEISK